MQEHPDEFDDSLENVTEILNSATGGEFGEVPASKASTEENAVSSATDDNGFFIMPQHDIHPEILVKLKSTNDKKDEYYKNSNNKTPEITIEGKKKTVPISMIGMSSAAIMKNIKLGIYTVKEAAEEAVKSFNDLASSGKLWCITTLSNMSKDAVDSILNSGDIADTVLIKVANEGIEVDPDKVVACHDVSQQLKEMKEDNNKKDSVI